MEREIRVQLTIEVDLMLKDNVGIDDVVERFDISDAWYSSGIWCNNFSVQDYKEIDTP